MFLMVIMLELSLFLAIFSLFFMMNMMNEMKGISMYINKNIFFGGPTFHFMRQIFQDIGHVVDFLVYHNYLQGPRAERPMKYLIYLFHRQRGN